MTGPHPTTEELLTHAQRASLPAATLEVSEHLAACAACRTTLAQWAPAPAATWDALPPDSLPGADYETLTSYLDGAMDPVEREILEADLHNHPGLAAQLVDLRRWRAEDELAASTRPATLLPFPAPARRSFLPWALAAAAVVALSITVGRFWPGFAPRGAAATLRDDGREGSVSTLLSAADIPADLKAAAQAAFFTGEILPLADWQTWRGERGTLLADAPSVHLGLPSFSLREPVGVAVRGLRPVFRWGSSAGASAYQVTLAETPDGEVQSSPVLPAAGAAENTWIAPQPLAAGRRYAWEVRALDAEGNTLEKAPSPPEPEARFRTLDATREAELRRLESAHPRAHLLLAVANARLGLLPEAEGRLQRLATANPGQPLPGVLLRKLQMLRAHDQPSGPATKTATNGAR